MSRPTIGLIISVGWGVRTFLQTDVLATLLDAGRVVVFTDSSMVDELHARWGDRITVEALAPFAGPQQDTTAYGPAQGRHELAFQHRSATGTRRAKQRMHQPSSRRQRLSIAARRARAALGATVDGVTRLRRAAAGAFFEHHPIVVAHYEALFRRHGVSMVLSTVAYLPIETPPMLIAKRMGLVTGCWVNSWDNLTSKGPMALAFDHYFVWSDRIEDELRQNYPESVGRPCTATGVPHFDGYALPDDPGSRDALFRRLGLDPARPMVLYAACTPFLAPHEHRIVEQLADALRGNTLLGGAVLGETLAGVPQLVVRLHPNDPGTRFEALAERPEVTLQLARTSRDTTRGMQAFLPTDDENALALDTIRHADTVINIASTITLEAAICDRPVINVAYDLGPDPEHGRRIAAFYDYDHYRTVIEHNAAHLVRTPEALIDAVRHTLADPTDQRDGRRALATLWCGPNDGAAGHRLGVALLDAAGRVP